MASIFSSPRAENKDNSSNMPQLQTRNSNSDPFSERPSTPSRNSFISPVSTPQGSPSKKQNPPGAHDLPAIFDNVLRLTPGGSTFGSPTKTNVGQTSALSPGRNNATGIEDGYFGNAVNDPVQPKSAISPGSPLRKHGKENTPPSSRPAFEVPQQTAAALSRQDIYQPREQTVRRYNTQRGLTPEELEILQKPNVKRLANVTQLCRS